MPAPPAPRDVVEAAAQALADLPAFVYRWDPAARRWRDSSRENRLAPDLSEVINAAHDALSAALELDEPPLAFRAVKASSTAEAERLAAVTDWAADRAARQDEATRAARATWEQSEASKADRRRLAGMPRLFEESQEARARESARRDLEAGKLDSVPFRWPPYPPAVDPDQRERWRVACSSSRLATALYRASGIPALRHSSASGASDFDRDWLRSLPRVPGARLTTRAFREAYNAHCAEHGKRPLADVPLKNLAVEVLGDGDERACRKRTADGWLYLDVQLPGALRLVPRTPDSALTG